MPAKSLAQLAYDFFHLHAQPELPGSTDIMYFNLYRYWSMHYNIIWPDVISLARARFIIKCLFLYKS